MRRYRRWFSCYFCGKGYISLPAFWWHLRDIETVPMGREKEAIIDSFVSIDPTFGLRELEIQMDKLRIS